MLTRLVPLRELSPALHEAWVDLAARAAEPNPFHEPAYVLAAARHLGHRWPDLLVVEEDGRLLACIPIRRSPSLRGRPLLNVSVWRHEYSLLGTPLVDRDRAGAALKSAIDGIVRLARPFRIAVFEWVGDDGPVGEALERALVGHGLGPLRYRSFSRAVLRRRSDEALPDRLAGRHSRLRQLRRALERECGTDLNTVNRSGDRRAIEQFLSLEASGWKGRAGTAMACRPGHADFFRDLCTELARENRMQLLSLEARGSPIAMQLSVESGEGLFCIKSAYDERHARFSPGAQLELDVIGRFYREGRARWIDSCTDPGNSLMNRLFPDRRRISTLLVPPPGRLVSIVVGKLLRSKRKIRPRG